MNVQPVNSISLTQLMDRWQVAFERSVLKRDNRVQNLTLALHSSRCSQLATMLQVYSLLGFRSCLPPFFGNLQMVWAVSVPIYFPLGVSAVVNVLVTAPVVISFPVSIRIPVCAGRCPTRTIVQEELTNSVR